MKKFLIFIIILIVLVASIIIYNKVINTKSKSMQEQNRGSKNELKASGFIVSLQNINNHFETAGTLSASEEIELHPETSGRITFINDVEGAIVSKGTLLLKLNDAELQAQFQKLKVQKTITEKNEKRMLELLDAKGVGQQEYDAVLLQLNNIKADIEIISAQIEKTEIRAPFTGKLGLRQVSVGAYVSPSNIITTLQQVNKLKLDFFIPEKYSFAVKKGGKIHFKTEISEDDFSAIIYAIEPKIDEQSRSIQVRASVDNPKEILNPGAFVKVDIDIADTPQAMMIPSECIIPDEEGSKVVVSENGIAVFRKIRTGFRTNSEVQVYEGISENDTIVQSGLMFVKPDMKLVFDKLHAANQKTKQL